MCNVVPMCLIFLMHSCSNIICILYTDLISPVFHHLDWWFHTDNAAAGGAQGLLRRGVHIAPRRTHRSALSHLRWGRWGRQGTVQWRLWWPTDSWQQTGWHCLVEHQALHCGTVSRCLLQGGQLYRLDPKEANHIGLDGGECGVNNKCLILIYDYTSNGTAMSLG